MSPWYGRHTSAVLVDEVTPSIEHPAVMQRHEGVSGCGGRVLSILTVCILQRGELVFPQHLVHNKGPVGRIHRITSGSNTDRRWYSDSSLINGLQGKACFFYPNLTEP